MIYKAENLLISNLDITQYEIYIVMKALYYSRKPDQKLIIFIKNYAMLTEINIFYYYIMDIDSIFKNESTRTLPSVQTHKYSTNIMNTLVTVVNKIQPLKYYAYTINQQFQQLKQDLSDIIAQSIKKITLLHYQICEQKEQLQQQLKQEKYLQNKMKQEVIQLREMINQFLQEHNKQINWRDLYICLLQEYLEINHIPVPHFQDKKITDQQSKLASILEVSQCQTSKKSSKLNTMRQLSQNITTQKSKQSEPTKNKIRNFIDSFRKTIEESQSQEKLKIQKINQICYYQNKLKIECSLLEQTTFRTNSLNNSHQSGDLAKNKNNELSKIDSPKNISFLKKNSQRYCNRHNMYKQQHQENQKQNYALQELDNRKYHERNNSEQKQGQSFGKYQNRSSSRNASLLKENIKTPDKILNKDTHNKKSKKKVVSVRLGKTEYINKISKNLKQAFLQYILWPDNLMVQIKFEGQVKQQYREGFGKLFYKNGFVYEGFFKKNLKHGKGIIKHKNKVICQGTWQCGQISGQVFICLGIMSLSCSQFLKQAIIKGYMHRNLFEGSCDIIFPTNKQKIVTKFHKGIPIGQFTLYGQQTIDFGLWPE